MLSPITYDRAKISLKLQMEAYVGPAIGLQPRIKAVSYFRCHSRTLDGPIRYLLKVFDTVTYWDKVTAS